MGYRIKVGNTTIEIEDLGRTYPGVCQHCGKTGIRYLAHVYQDLASTIVKEKEGEIVRSKDEICQMGIAIISGKRSKTIDVGCVCVAKYLVDCGVDAGLALRLQKEVTTITGYLQQCATLEAAKAPEKLAVSLQNAELVYRLLQRRNRVRDAYTRCRGNDGIYGEWSRVYSGVNKHFFDADSRWKRENHGFRMGRNLPQATDLVRHYDLKIAAYTKKLSLYTSSKASYA